jgi:putative component of membrane protein insertase Oxa1/YidC/SpoIIIJ protein YidD
MRSPLASILIVAIRMYRAAGRRIDRSRSCLYDVSCSRHVERVAAAHGFVAAMSAMRRRFSACRPQYSFEYDDAQWWIATRDGQIITSDEASPALISEARACRVPVGASTYARSHQ